MSLKLFYDAANKNKGPICDILKQVIEEHFYHTPKVSVLEIASGTGQQAVHFSSTLPNVIWQPTEVDSRCLDSINNYVKESHLPNILKPVKLDVTQSYESLKTLDDTYDVIVSVNFVHITHWECSKSLYKLAGNLLSSGGILLIYGPFADHGVITPDSNIIFNKTLQSANASWGLRDIVDLSALATEQNMKLENIYNMPSNNKMILWRKLS